MLIKVTMFRGSTAPVGQGLLIFEV